MGRKDTLPTEGLKANGNKLAENNKDTRGLGFEAAM